MDWYWETLKKYAEFSGRACRAEYWSFFIINAVAMILLTVMDIAAGTYSKHWGVGLFGGVFSLLLLLPSVAVSVRRLHDTARSAWWLLIGFIPLLGPLTLVVFYLLAGTPGANEYGDDPLAVPAAPEPVMPAPAPPPPPPPPAA